MSCITAIIGGTVRTTEGIVRTFTGGILMVSESKDPEIQKLVEVLEQVFPNGGLNSIPLPPWVARPKNPYVRLALALHRLGVRKLDRDMLSVQQREGTR